MGFFDKLFGGTDRSAQKKTLQDNAQRQKFTEQQMAQARGDLLGLAPGMQQNANMGFQSALDVLGQAYPQQMDIYQQGNVGAQNQLIAGVPQVHNAILGMPVDYSVFQPQALNYDASWTQQQLPQYVSAGDLLGGQAPQAPQANPYSVGFSGAAQRGWPGVGYYQS